MQQRPREYVLDIYKLLLGGFVALSPWLFAFRYEAARLESVASGVLVVGISIAALIAFADWRPIFAAPQACSAGFGPARRPGFGAKIPVGKGQAWQSWLAFARPAKFRLKAEWRGRGKRRKCDRPSRFWIGPLVRHPRP
jgi:hypothetical protein